MSHELDSSRIEQIVMVGGLVLFLVFAAVMPA